MMEASRSFSARARKTLFGLTLSWFALTVFASDQVPPLRLVNDVYPPFVLEKDNPLGEGIDIEIAKEALRRGGAYSVNVILVPWKRALHMLSTGEADFTTTISRTSERDAFLSWSSGYRTSTIYNIYASPSVALDGIDDLKGKTIGTTRGYTYPDRITGISGLVIDESNSIESTLKKLVARRVDAIIINSIVGQWEINRLGLSTQVGHPAIRFNNPDKSPTRMGFSRKREQLQAINAMNKGLAEMLKDGSIQRIERKYLRQ